MQSNFRKADAALHEIHEVTRQESQGIRDKGSVHLCREKEEQSSPMCANETMSLPRDVVAWRELP